MKKLLIGSFVGAILLFGWQAVSWTVIGVHDNSFKYSPNQDSIMSYLEKNLSGEGDYLLPAADPKLSKKEKMKQQEARMTQPWAGINFHQTHEADMPIVMLKGFINCFICALLACLVIRKFDVRYKTFFSLFTAALTFGVISFLFIWYTQHNWFQTTWEFLWGEMIDNLIGWGLVGVWLGWYFKK